MTNVEPGYYHAEGDPVGTVRYWDGSSWTTGPMTPPPAAAPTPVQTAATPGYDRDRFGGVGARIGAALIDTVIYIVIVLAIAIPIGIASEPGLGILAGAAVVFLLWPVFVAMTALYGWTPGKLAVGLRVTTSDGVTTPPGWSPAFVRTLPGLVAVVPGVGGLLNLALQVVNVILVNSDDERRSVYDRAGQTRVVRLDRLDR